MSKDYYKILEINEKANDDEIKKSFKKLSLKYHPDRNPENKEECEAKYKEIVEAYEVLNDKTKKNQYDQAKSGKKAGLFDIFNTMFNVSFNTNKRYKQEIEIQLTLEDVFKGYSIHKKLKLEKDCDLCLGLGKKDFSDCTICNGKGLRQINQQLPFGFFNQLVPCNVCHQKGKIPSGDDCEKCNGNCKINKIISIPINFPPGVIDNEKIVHIDDNVEFCFIAKIIPHNEYTRLGNKLKINKEISLLEALTGFQFNLKLLDGRIIEVKNQENTIVHPGMNLRLKNLGINGDEIIVNFKVIFPEKLQTDQIEQLKEIFVLPSISNEKECEEIVDIYYLEP
jgi:DnaJ-class molecular chaperone